MRRLTVVLLSVIVLCVVISCIPLLFGIHAKDKIIQTIREINHSQSVNITVQHYQRNWFSSRVRLRIEITDQRLLRGYRALLAHDDPQSLTLALTAHIAHGPVFAYHSPEHTFHSSVGWAYLHGTASVPQHQHDLATIGIKLGFTGGSHIVMHYLPVNYTNGDLEINTKGASGQWSLDPELNHIQGDHTGKQLNINLGDTVITLADKMRLHIDQQRTDYGFWTGTFDVQLPAVTISTPKQPVMVINNINIAHSAKVQSDLLHTQINVSADNVTDKHDAMVGPLHIQFDVQDVDAGTLARMSSVSQQLNAALLAKSTPAASSMQQRMRVIALQQQLLSLLPALLAQGATFSLTQFELTTPQGIIQASASIDFAKQPANSDPAHFMSVLNQAKASLTIAVPKPLMQIIVSYITAAQLQSLTQQQQDLPVDTVLPPPPDPALVAQSQQIATTLLTHLVEQGVLVEQGTQYAVSLDYQQGALQLNQQQTTLVALINKLTQSSAQVLSSPTPGKTQTTTALPAEPTTDQHQQQ